MSLSLSLSHTERERERERVRERERERKREREREREINTHTQTLTHTRIKSSEPIAGYKRSAPDAPDTSDNGSQPERGKKAEAAGQKLDQAERQRNNKLRRYGEARSLSREER